MESLPALFAQYGLAALFAVVLAEQLGLPLPALPALLLAGALAADDPLYGVAALALAIVASTLGDYVWFRAGQRHGHRVLRLLCRISLSPDACVRQTENAYERRGVATLVIAKFVPGLSTLAPPLAGALGLSVSNFLLFNTAGAALWAGAGLIAGLLFHRQIDGLLAWLAQMGVVAALLLGAALALYIGYRWWDRRRTLGRLAGARITPAELAGRLTGDDPPLILDARSRLGREADGSRIPGALAVDLDDLDSVLAKIPAGREVVVYCACPNDASAVKLAWLLTQHGHTRVRPLAGGIDAWREAGLVLDTLG